MVFVNGIAVVLGGLAGCLFRKRIRPDAQKHFMPVFAAISTAIGIRLVAEGGNTTVAVIAVLLGMAAGELLQLETRILRLTGSICRRVPIWNQAQEPDSGQLFVSAFILTVCSTVGILGAMTARITGDFSLLFTKAVLDFLVCLFFAISAGPSIMLLGIPTFLVVFAVYACSGLLVPLISAEMRLDFCLCGGIIQLVNSYKLLRGKEITVANLIPALILVFFVSYFYHG